MYSLETPESVAIGYDVAGVGSRFLAALIDSLIQGAVLIAVWIVMFAVGTNLSGAGAYAVFAVGTLIIFAVLLGYYIFFELLWNGQSPGKRAIHVRVIMTSGYPVTPLAVVIRNVVRIVDYLPAFYAVGVISMIANRRARRLGDLAAGTMVVKEGREGSLASLSSTQTTASSLYVAPSAPYGTASPPYGTAPPPVSGAPSAPYAAAPPPYGTSSVNRPPMPTPLYPGPGGVPVAPLVAAGAEPQRLTREDEALIRDFLGRRYALPLQRRDELARQIATVVHNRIGGPSPLYGPQGPEPYLEQVLAAREAGRTWRGQ